MVPRRAERVFCHEPAGRENYKVGDCGSWSGGGGCEDGEDAGVRVVVGDGADGVEAGEVVFVGVVEAVPGDDVEGGVCLCSCEEAAGEFGKDGVCGVPGSVFSEGGFWGLEIPRVGEAIRTDRAKVGEVEVTLIEFKNVAAGGAVWEGDAIADAAGNDADFVGPDKKRAEFSGNIQRTMLGNNEKVTVSGVEGGMWVHRFAGCEDEDSEALLHCWVTSTSDEVEGVDPVD